MTAFNPIRFKRYATELSEAVFALSHERQQIRRYGVRYSTQESEMSATPISRLRDKLVKASGVAQRAATVIEAEADALIAQENVIKAKTMEAFAPHKAILAEADTELQAIKNVLNLMSNGGPPLSDAPPESRKPIAPVIPSSDLIHDDTGKVERLKLSQTNSVSDG